MIEREEPTPFKPEDNESLVHLRESYINGQRTEITGYIAQDTTLIHNVSTYLNSDRLHTEVSVTEQVRLLYNTLKALVTKDPLSDIRLEEDFVVSKTYTREFQINPTRGITVSYSQFVDGDSGNVLILQSMDEESDDHMLEYCLMDDGSFAVNTIDDLESYNPGVAKPIAQHIPMRPDRTTEESKQMLHSCIDLVTPLIEDFSQK